MDRTKIIVSGIIALVILAFAVWGIFNLYQNSLDSTVALKSPLPSPIGVRVLPTPTPPAGQSTAMYQPGLSQPQTGSDTQEIKNIGISIDSLESGDTISSPIQIKGRANVMDGKVILEVKDASGNILGTASAAGCLGLDACPFETTISFNKPQTAYGTLEAYNPTESGSELYLQKVLVNF